MDAHDCSDLGHGANHAVQAGVDEHLEQFCKMFPAADATHTAMASGSWSSPDTWKNRVLPGTDARVVIPSGVTVTIDRELSAPLFWVRIDGVLRFSPSASTLLVVDTLKVESTGRLEIGTADRPIPANVSARVVVKARGGKAIDHQWDPLELSRGLIALGLVEIHGAQKTPFVSVSRMPRTGTDTIVVDQPPAGWVAGDQLVLTATQYDQDETFKVVRVEGTTITVDHSVQHLRVLPSVEDAPGFAKPALHLSNFSRNVQIRSAGEYAGDSKLQGHVMLLHRGGHKIAWVGLYDMGRTTVKAVTDPTFQDGKRDAGISPAAGISEENIRGRYSLHFHRAGSSASVSTVEGCAVEVQRGAGFKIGIANHSSNISVRRCVSHNIDGSHFFTEEGDEIGDLTGNLAIHSTGSGYYADEQPRGVERVDRDLYNRRRADFGHRGTGFWMNGGGVDVIDNISAGHAHVGFNVWNLALNFRREATFEVRFPVSNLRDASWTSGTDLRIPDVPIRFVGNTAYVLALKNGANAGFAFDGHGLQVKSRFPNAPYSQVHNLLSWNAGGFKTAYSGNLHLKNVRIIGNFSPTDVIGARLGTQRGNHDLVENLRVEGFTRGVTLPMQSVIKGGFFSSIIGIAADGNAQGTTIDLREMKFGDASPAVSEKAGVRTATAPRQSQYDLYVSPIIPGAETNLSIAFASRPVYIQGHSKYPQGAQLYSPEQMPDYVLPDLGIPGLLDGKTTTGEAWQKYRLAPGGAVAPVGAVPLSGLRSNGLVGSVAEDAARPQRGRRIATRGERSDVRTPSARVRTGIADGPLPRRSRQAAVRPTREEAAAAREQRRAGERTPDQRPPERERAATVDRVRPQDSANADSGWKLVAQGDGRSILMPSGLRPNPPRVSAGSDQTVALRSGALLQGTVGSAAASWSRAYGPGSVTFENSSAAQTRAQFSAPGTYVLHLTAKSAGGRTNTAVVTITVVE